MISFDDGTRFAYESVGEFHADRQWIHPSRSIGSFELILVQEGTVYIREAEIEYSLSPGEALVLEPGKPHGGTRTVDPPVAFYWFHFQTDIPFDVKRCDMSGQYEIKQLFKRLLHMTNTPGYSAAEADAVGYLILRELMRIDSENTQSGRVLMKQIREFIRNYSGGQLTVRLVAEHFGYNPDYMGKLFQKHYRMGFKEYLTAQQLKQIKELLLTTDKPIKQIARELGYEQENLLTKFFLYHEKISPVEFRNRYYNTHINNH